MNCEPLGYIFFAQALVHVIGFPLRATTKRYVQFYFSLLSQK